MDQLVVDGTMFRVEDGKLFVGREDGKLRLNQIIEMDVGNLLKIASQAELKIAGLE